jgi:Zinc carboxypeptidase
MTTRSRLRRRAASVTAIGLLTLATGAPAAQAPALAALKTRAESSDYRETSRYDDVVAFMDAVAKAAPKTVRLTTFGKTFEGRDLPLAVLGAPSATPDAVKRTGKLRVYIQGNIHGGEVEGKESAQMLLRDLAQGKHAEWLRSMVLLVAPIYNADGNERIATNNRGRQNGPVTGQGQRPNAQGYDLNRDHMKLESPEARSFVKLLNDYDPQVTLDLHTTNGTQHAYYLTYSPPLNPATDPAVIDLLRKEWLPAVTTAVKTKYDWDIYYYGNVEGRSQERAWRTFDHRPRFNNNYVGLRNRFAILSEAYAYATFEDRIVATNRFVEEALTFANANARRIRDEAAQADRRTVVGARLGLRAELERGPDVEILLGEVTEEKNPVSGGTMYRRVNVRKPERMPEYGTFKATETERVPSAYYVPATLTAAVEHLRAHGVQMTPLKTAQTVTVEEFRITDTQSAREFQGHQERTVTGSWTEGSRELPAGTLRVDMRQPLARLAFYLIEPRSDDGLLDWNILDGALGADPQVYPIVRTRE